MTSKELILFWTYESTSCPLDSVSALTCKKGDERVEEAASTRTTTTAARKNERNDDDDVGCCCCRLLSVVVEFIFFVIVVVVVVAPNRYRWICLSPKAKRQGQSKQCK